MEAIAGKSIQTDSDGRSSGTSNSSYCEELLLHDVPNLYDRRSGALTCFSQILI